MTDAPLTKKRDEALALALARGLTVGDAAVQAGLSERTAYRRLTEQAFRERVQHLRAAITDENAARLAAAGEQAIDGLLLLLHGPTPPAVRLGAAKAIIELGVKLKETVELESRIAALEAAAHAKGILTP